MVIKKKSRHFMKHAAFYDGGKHAARLNGFSDQLNTFPGLENLKCTALIWGKLIYVLMGAKNLLVLVTASVSISPTLIGSMDDNVDYFL